MLPRLSAVRLTYSAKRPFIHLLTCIITVCWAATSNSPKFALFAGGSQAALPQAPLFVWSVQPAKWYLNFIVAEITSLFKMLNIAFSVKRFDSSNFSSAWINSSSEKVLFENETRTTFCLLSLLAIIIQSSALQLVSVRLKWIAFQISCGNYPNIEILEFIVLEIGDWIQKVVFDCVFQLVLYVSHLSECIGGIA